VSFSSKTQVPENLHKTGAIDINTIRGRRYHELDSLRGIASLTVFFSHFALSNTLSGPAFSKMSMSPLHLFWDGESAVLFFFVLSGFVLALPYVSNDEKPLDLLAFYNTRIFRIFPAFIVTILLCIVLKAYVYQSGNLQHYSEWLRKIWSWDFKDIYNKKEAIKTFFLIVFDYNTNLIDPPIWSLLVEMRMSFLIPFMVISVRKNSFLFNALFIVAFTYMGADFYIGVFYLGIILAKYHDILGRYIRNAPGYVIALLFAAAIGLYSNHYALNIGNTPGETSRLHLYLSVIGSGMFIILAVHQQGFSAFLKNKACLFLGRISYSFYLIHLPILITVASVFPYKDNYSLIPLLLISLTMAWLASFLLYTSVELPFQRLANLMVKKYSFFTKIRYP